MPEIHPAVDAEVINAKKKEQQATQERREARERLQAAERERCLKRFKSTGKRILWKAIGVFIAIVILSIASGLNLMAPGLVRFLISVACYWLAIQLGAWLQYVFCERGYMK